MQKIKLVHTGGPFGDCTDNYDVEFPKEWSVREFIMYIVREYSVDKGEWGSFSISCREYSHQPILEYRRGSVSLYEWSVKLLGEERVKELHDIALDILHKKQDARIMRITANGGWSNMSYDLYLREDTDA